MKIFRNTVIGYALVMLLILFALRDRIDINSYIFILVIIPIFIALLVYYFLQLRLDIKRQVGMKIILLGSIGNMGHIVLLGLFIARWYVLGPNPTLSSKILTVVFVISVLTFVAMIMYQNEMRKWWIEQSRKHQDSSDSVEE